MGWILVAFLSYRYVASGKIHIEAQPVLQPLLRGLAVHADLDGQVAIMQKQMLDALVNILVEGNLGQNRAGMDAARKFLEYQFRKFEAKLQEAEHRLAAFQPVKMEYLPSDGCFQRQLHEKRKRLEQAQFSLTDLVRKQDFLQRELGDAPEILFQLPEVRARLVSTATSFGKTTPA